MRGNETICICPWERADNIEIYNNEEGKKIRSLKCYLKIDHSRFFQHSIASFNGFKVSKLQLHNSTIDIRLD